ncbi:MAG: peptidoglycan editing factor PgeF [Anaerolineaceae bacterium]
MPIHELNGLRNFSFESFPSTDITQGIFCRKGGVSPDHWSSLNLGGTNGDSRANIIENRKRIFDAMQRNVESIFDVWQVHGVETICTDQPRPLDAAHQQADIILTDKPEITLFMRFADCVPIFLYDPQRRVIGIVHAGWQGTVKKAASVAVLKMVSIYGCKAENILAGIGPSIGPHHYQIGEDVEHRVRSAFKSDADLLLTQKNGSWYFDLWQANRLNLEKAGINSIEIAGICTACNTMDWYSHRAENGKTGRFGALLAMN